MTLTRRYSFSQEPRGRDYQELLRLAEQACSQALVVLRPGNGLMRQGRTVLDRLGPFVLSREQGTAWPGTMLLAGEATLVRFDLGGGSLEVIGRAAAGLFEWKQPELPEDLCLFRSTGEPWLVTISHERDVYVDLTDTEHDMFKESRSRLAQALMPDAELQ